MITIHCQTFDWGWEITVRHTKGLKETPILSKRYPRNTVAGPRDAIRLAVSETYSYIDADEPEQPEHS